MNNLKREPLPKELFKKGTKVIDEFKDEFNFYGLHFIFGIKAEDEMDDNQEPCLHTLNDFEIDYVETKGYHIIWESIYEFSDYKGQAQYMLGLLFKFKKWCKEIGVDVDSPPDLNLLTSRSDDYFSNLKEAYDWFNCFVTGFCNLRDGNEYIDYKENKNND